MVVALLDSLDKDITLKRLLVFAMVADAGSVNTVAKALREEASAVRQNLTKLREVYGGRPLCQEARDSDGKLALTELGRELLPIAKQSVHLWSAARKLGGGAIVLEFLPQHTYFVSPITKDLSDTVKIKRQPLGEHDRDRS